MKITGIEVIPFETSAPRISFGELLSDHTIVQTVTKVATDEGVEGYYFGGHFHGDQDGLLAWRPALITRFLGPLLAGNDPFDRERIWQQLWAAKLPENVCSVIDLALWDLAGRAAGLPVHKLLGGARETVKAYASTFNNMGMPEDYAEHALDVQAPGLPRVQDPPLLRLGPRDPKPTLPEAVARRLGHRDLPRRPAKRSATTWC